MKYHITHIIKLIGLFVSGLIDWWTDQLIDCLCIQGGDKKSTEKSKDKDKVKTAKKIQKDMEKWAKTLNQKKNMPVSMVS